MRGLVVAAVGVCLLAGCAEVPAPVAPQGVSVEEAEQRVLDRNEFWWFLIAPQDAPMPEVEPIAYSTDDEKALECFSQSTGIPSITYQGQVGYWIGPNGEPLSDAQNRALFVCTLQYPIDVSDPAAIGMFSEEERAWAWNYQRTRLVPCLQLMGFAVDNRDGGYIPSTPWWSPYDDIAPVPSAAQWQRIDDRCPPSPYGPTR